MNAVNTWSAAALAAVIAVSTSAAAHAQRGGIAGTEDPYPVSEQVRRSHMVQVSPHRIVLTPQRRSATLTLANGGNAPIEADVEIQFAYPYWQTTDTALFVTDWRVRRARDTVVVDPGPSERFAGRWMSGVPSHVSLKPRETRQVTLRINPPAGLPDGEYWARITTIVRTNKEKPPKAKDEKATFRVPIAGVKVPDVRDSTEVFYRQGVTSTGLEVVRAAAEVDMQNRPSPVPSFGPQQLWLLFHVRPAGPAHFEGQMRAVARAANGQTYEYEPAYQFSMYKEGIMRFWARTSHLPHGQYTMVVTFEGPEGGGEGVLPVKPAVVEIPFEVP